MLTVSALKTNFNIYYLACDGIMAVCICLNSSNCMHYIYAVFVYQVDIMKAGRRKNTGSTS